MRQISQQLPHVPWVRILAEFVAITAAVFLGLLADNYREYGVERAAEIEYLHQILEDLARDSEALQYTSRGIERQAVSSQQVHDFVGGRQTDIVEIQRSLAILTNVSPYEQQRQSFIALTAGPGLHIVLDRDLRLALFEYYEVDQTRFQQDYMLNYALVQRDFLERLFNRILFMPSAEVHRLWPLPDSRDAVRLLEPISNFHDDVELVNNLARLGLRAHEIVDRIATMQDRNMELRSRLELAIGVLEE